MLTPNARRSPGYVTNVLYFYLQVLALHLVRLVVELREDGGEARVGGRAIWFLGRELERAERLVAPDLELRDPRREPACAVHARCVRESGVRESGVRRAVACVRAWVGCGWRSTRTCGVWPSNTSSRQTTLGP